jgi:hypothetical protein
MNLRRADSVPPGENVLAGTIRDIIYLGQTLHIIVAIPSIGDITVALRNEGQITRPLAWKRGESAIISWSIDDCQILEES